MSDIKKIAVNNSEYYFKDELVRNSIGVASSETSLGIAPLDASGKVPSENLPSYVDDVIEGYYSNGVFYNEQALTTQITPETGKIYVDKTTNKTYRYGSSLYVIVSNGDGAITTTINKTWAQLKAMRDGGTLVPGQWYRITDYTCTTTQENTLSAGHVFDIIVRADDVNVLNENAYAALHAGDTYFANCNLAAWELKYCLDNDTAKFAWADSTNGKGVVYYMKDEFNNECPYDFKNIQFKRWYTTDSVANRSGLNGCYMVANLNDAIKNLSVVDDTNFIFAYTFSSQQTGGTQTDFSLGGNAVYGNVIRPLLKELNNIVFYGENNYLNTFDGYCSRNSFGNNCNRNSFGNKCNSNSFGNSCRYNSFENDCFYNSFGDNCQYNSFVNSCHDNSFGGECKHNSFGINFYHNSFGNSCQYNSFGNNCIRNSFGNKCNSNSFGNSCQYNSFENNCGGNSFGNNCQYNSFPKYYSRCIIFENNNRYITLTSTQTTSSTQLLLHIKICQGVNSTSAAKTISHDTVNDAFQTEYKATNSQIISI